MADREYERNLKPVPGAVLGLAGIAALTLTVGASAFFAPRPAGALPAYAQQTGLGCGRCHANPAGGGALTAFGKAFAANGHKVPSKGAKPGKTGAAAPPSAVPAAASVVVYDYAQAGAWSLRHPYYTHFLYSPDDYRR